MEEIKEDTKKDLIKPLLCGYDICKGWTRVLNDDEFAILRKINEIVDYINNKEE